jgi:hypothetical protein
VACDDESDEPLLPHPARRHSGSAEHKAWSNERDIAFRHIAFCGERTSRQTDEGRVVTEDFLESPAEHSTPHCCEQFSGGGVREPDPGALVDAQDWRWQRLQPALRVRTGGASS